MNQRLLQNGSYRHVWFEAKLIEISSRQLRLGESQKSLKKIMKTQHSRFTSLHYDSIAAYSLQLGKDYCTGSFLFWQGVTFFHNHFVQNNKKINVLLKITFNFMSWKATKIWIQIFKYWLKILNLRSI